MGPYVVGYEAVGLVVVSLVAFGYVLWLLWRDGRGDVPSPVDGRDIVYVDDDGDDEATVTVLHPDMLPNSDD